MAKEQAAMGSISEILARAQARAQQANLPYHGALTPQEAQLLLTLAPQARLVDVRARAEWDLTGVIPGSVQVEWQTYPGWHLNPYFVQQLKQMVDHEALAMFICRSGGRSHKAAEAATQAGFLECYNVLEGFEGDRDKVTQQRNLNGWKKAGLPWVQS
jgi:rhodanese-related sulfurtransferase